MIFVREGSHVREGNFVRGAIRNEGKDKLPVEGPLLSPTTLWRKPKARVWALTWKGKDKLSTRSINHVSYAEANRALDIAPANAVSLALCSGE